MAKVPKIERVTAGDIAPLQQRTLATRPQATQLHRLQQSPQAAASSRALEVFGNAVMGIGREMAAERKVIREREAARDRAIDVKRSLLAFSEKAASAALAFRNLKGEEALNAAKAHEETMDAFAREELDGIIDPETRAAAEIRIGNARLNSRTADAAFILVQRREYQDSVSRGLISVARQGALSFLDGSPNSAMAQPAIKEHLNTIIAETMELAAREGVSKEETEALVLKAITGVHVSMVTGLLDSGRGGEARTYFEAVRARGQLLEGVAAKLEGQVRKGVVLQESHSIVDQVMDSGLPSAKARRELGIELAGDRPEVRKEVEAQLRLLETALDREQKEVAKAHRASVWEFAFGGGNLRDISTEQREAINSVPGLMRKLEAEEQRVAAGAPAFSAPGEAARLQEVFLRSKQEFLELDISVMDLSLPERNHWLGVQRDIDTRLAREEAKQDRESVTSARHSRIRSAVGQHVKLNKWKLNDEEQEAVIQAVMRRAEARFTDEGKELSDLDYLDMANAAMLQGEDIKFNDQGEQIFGLPYDPDIILAQSVIDSTLSFVGTSGFAEANAPYVANQTVKINARIAGSGKKFREEDIAKLVERLARKRILPTFFVLMQEVRNQLGAVAQPGANDGG